MKELNVIKKRTAKDFILFVGPDHSSDLIQYIKKTAPKNSLIIGDGKREVSQDEILSTLEKHSDQFTQVHFLGHGSVYGNEHYIQMDNQSIRTKDLIQNIERKFIYKPKLNIWSCNGFVTKNTLGEDEFVVQHSSSEYHTLMAVNVEEIVRLAYTDEKAIEKYGRSLNIFDILEYGLLLSPECKGISGIVKGTTVFHETSANKEILNTEEAIRKDRLEELQKFRRFRKDVLGHSKLSFLPIEKELTPIMISRYRELDIFMKVMRDCPENQVLKYLQDYLENGGNPNATLITGESLLQCVCGEGYKEACDLLLSKGAKINHRKNDGYSILHYLCGKDEKSRDMLKHLLTKDNINVNIQNKDGYSPLQIALTMDNQEAMQALMNAGADVNLQDKYGKTVLHYAIKKDDIEMVRLLAQQKNTDFYLTDKEDLTPLQIAYLGGNPFILQTLVNAGADINRKDENGMTLLHYATVKGDKSMMEWLLKEGADPTIKNILGKTPLHYVAEKGNVEMVRLITKQKDIEVNLADNEGVTPFHLACQNGHVGIAKLLFDAGKIDINQTTKKGETALYLACLNKKLPLARQLLEWKAGVNSTDSLGNSPLHLACMNNHVPMVELLLENKADMHAKSTYLITPLMVAVIRGHKEVVDILLPHITKSKDLTAPISRKEFKEFLQTHKVDILDNIELSGLAGKSLAKIARERGFKHIAREIEHYAEKQEKVNGWDTSHKKQLKKIHGQEKFQEKNNTAQSIIKKHDTNDSKPHISKLNEKTRKKHFIKKIIKEKAPIQTKVELYKNQKLFEKVIEKI